MLSSRPSPGSAPKCWPGRCSRTPSCPEDVARFDQLKHVEETSRNASTVFFGLLAASLYSWLTIATTTDVALITGTASSPLPIINTNIALSGFYLAAPLILIAVYFYFHLYLQRLWRGLASLPAVFPDGEALDDKAYPWLLNGLVRAHFKKLELAQRPLTRVENFVSILLAWWVVPFTLLAFWLRFLPRHDWWVTTLHVAPDRGRRMVWGVLVPARRADAQRGSDGNGRGEERRSASPGPNVAYSPALSTGWHGGGWRWRGDCPGALGRCRDRTR